MPQADERADQPRRKALESERILEKSPEPAA
jgi:hypothetical protein